MCVMTGAIDYHQVGVGYPGGQLLLVFGWDKQNLPGLPSPGWVLDLVQPVHDRPILEQLSFPEDHRLRP